MQRTILSPHCEDAVLSCWHLLEGPGAVSVVNVFTALAPAQERLAGREALALDLPDHQRLPLDVLIERLDAAVPPGAVIHAPAALDGHPDHVLVRDAALRMARDGRRVELYADLPRAIAHGWPAWVTCRPEDDGGEAWSESMAAAGLVVERLVPRVRPLDSATRKRKRGALTADPGVRTIAPGEDLAVLGWEVYWEIPRSALGGSDRSESGGEAGIADPPGKALDDRF